MRLLLWFSLFIGTVYSAFGQNQKPLVKLSSEYDVRHNIIFQGHLHSDASGHYVYFKKFKLSYSPLPKNLTFLLEKYDTRLQKKFSKEFKSKSKNTHGIGLKSLGGQVIWLLYRNNKKKKELDFLVAPIDAKGKLQKAKKIVSYGYENKKDFPYISTSLSPDSTKLVLVAERKDYKSKKKFRAQVSVIDKDLNLLWTKEVELPASERRVRDSNYQVTSEGDVFFTCKIYNDHNILREERKGERDYVMNLFKINHKNQELKKQELDLGKGYFQQIKTSLNASAKNLVVLATYSDVEKGPTRGLFYHLIDYDTDAVVYSKKRPFKMEELNALDKRSVGKDRNGGRGLEDFTLELVQLKDEREILITIEQNFLREYSVGNSSTKKSLHCNELIFVNITEGGDVKMLSSIPKRISREGGDFNTYRYINHTSFEVKGKNYILYNDRYNTLLKGKKNPFLSKMMNSDRLAGALASFDEEGDVQKKMLINVKKGFKTTLLPEHSYQIGENEILFFKVYHRVLADGIFQLGTVTIR